MKSLDGQRSVEGFHVEHRNDRHPPIWGQLNTKKLGDNPATDIQLVSDPVHLQYSNRQTLGDIALVNIAGMRDGGVIPQTGEINTIQVTDNTRTTLFQPPKGEVHLVQSISVIMGGGSGSRTFDVYYFDGTNLSYWYYTSTTDSNVILTGDTNYPDFPVYIDNSMYFQIRTNGTFDTADWYLATYRVR